MTINLFNINIEVHPTRYQLVAFLFCIVAPGLLSWQGYWYWSFPTMSLGGLIAWVLHHWELEDNWMKKALANPSAESRWEWLLVGSGIIFFYSTFLCLIWPLL